MSLEIVRLTKQHLNQAALRVSQRCQELLKQVPALPARYAEMATLLPLLNDIIEAGLGSAAFEGGQLKGFLTAWLLPSFRGKRCAFSPEWANAALLPNSRPIYEALYTNAATKWAAEGYFTHLISLFPHDSDGLAGWHWLGFGMIAVDAVRDLQLIAERDNPVDIRQATPQDIEHVLKLNHALGRHSAGSPTFLVENETRDRSYYEEILADPDKAILLAERGAEPLAYLELGPASEDACTIIYDEKTTSIIGAFTEEQVRNTGVTTALLNRALIWARAQGYEHCAVDFEPMNYLARRFWLRYFQPVSYTLIRQVDERVLV